MSDEQTTIQAEPQQPQTLEEALEAMNQELSFLTTQTALYKARIENKEAAKAWSIASA